VGTEIQSSNAKVASNVPSVQSLDNPNLSSAVVKAKTGATVLADRFEKAGAPTIFQANGTAGAGKAGASDPPATFGKTEPAIPPDTNPSFGPDATPEEAAAYVLHVDQATGLGGPSQGFNLYAQAVADHQDDAAWLQSFHRALGSEKSAELISKAVDPTNYRDWDPDLVLEHVDAVRASLVTMHEAGALNQADMDQLMAHWTGNGEGQVWRGALFGGNRFNSGLAQLFRELPASAVGLKNLFFDSAVAASQNTELSGEMRNDVAAAAAFVLAGTDMDNQVVQLGELQAQGANRLGDFVTRAMASEKTVPTLLNSARNDRDISTGQFHHEIEERYDGIASIANALAYADLSLRDAHNRRAPYTQGQLSTIRQEFFVAAANGMEAHAGTWDDNVRLKDGLSVIFQNELDNLWQGNLAPNGASLANDTIQSALESFYEHALFTGPSGSQRDRTSAFLADKLRGWMDDVRDPALSDAAFEAKYGGLDRTQVSKIAGEMLGHVSNGMERALDGAKDKQAAQEAVLKTGFDLALSLLPAGGPIKLATRGALGELGVKALESFFGEIDGNLRSRLEDATFDEAKRILLDEAPDFVADAPLANLAEDLMDVIPESNARNYLTAFQASFTAIDRKYEPN
jgi:hypothetical protein